MSEFPSRPDSFSPFVPELPPPFPLPDEEIASLPSDELHETNETQELEAAPFADFTVDARPDEGEELNAQQVIDLEVRVAAGDEEALVTLLSHYGPRIYKMIAWKMRGRSRDLADDVYQEWQLSVFTSFTRFERDHERSFIAWITTIANYRVADEMRKLTKQHRREMPISDFNAQAEAQSQTVGLERRGGVIKERYPSDTDDEELYAVLAEISPKQRDIVVLRLAFGFSAEEAAEMADSTPGAVRVAQHRAIARLRQIVKQNPEKYVELYDRLFGQPGD